MHGHVTGSPMSLGKVWRAGRGKASGTATSFEGLVFRIEKLRE